MMRRDELMALLGEARYTQEEFETLMKFYSSGFYDIQADEETEGEYTYGVMLAFFNDELGKRASATTIEGYEAYKRYSGEGELA